MKPLGRIQNVSICFATDNNYATCLKVALFSLLTNRKRSFFYDILILHSQLSTENQDSLLSLISNDAGVSIRFVDITEETEAIKYDVGSYLTVATLYRLLLFSDKFADYDRILYLDCDVIVEGDISELFFEDMQGKALAAVPEASFRQLSYSKKAVFLDFNKPFNIDNYRTGALRMKYPENYVNAGVLLLDLQRCRELYSFDEVVGILSKHHYFYNDQDVINILFGEELKPLDVEWNYLTAIESFCMKRPEIYGLMFEDVKRSKPRLIHYVSSFKPWNSECPLADRYHYYEKLSNNMTGMAN